MDLICPRLGYFSTHSTNTEFCIVARTVSLVCFLGACVKDCISHQDFEGMVHVSSLTLVAGQEGLLSSMGWPQEWL